MLKILTIFKKVRKIETIQYKIIFSYNIWINHVPVTINSLSTVFLEGIKLIVSFIPCMLVFPVF